MQLIPLTAKEITMADDQGAELPPEGPAAGSVEKRREERYRVASVYRRYITLRVKSSGDFLPVVLGDFSRSGILFFSPAPFEADSHADCLISIPSVLSQEVPFGIRIKYCILKGDSFLVGAAIDDVAVPVWFDVFSEVHDFIVQRRDSVY